MNYLTEVMNRTRRKVFKLLRTEAAKIVLFSCAFRLANVDFFREFYNQTLKACI